MQLKILPSSEILFTSKHYYPTQKLTKKKRSRAHPDSSEFVPTTVPCPGCSTQLEARRWKGNKYQSRTEVLTPSQDYALINLSGK